MSPITKKNETVRNLRVLYTDPERLDLGRKLAGAYQDIEQVNKDFDSVKADFKARITSHEAKITDLASKVSNGFRIEEVKCEWRLDAPEKGKKSLFRQDTSEVVETVDMTGADLQSQLPLADAAAAPVVGEGGVVEVPADTEPKK